MTTTQTRTALPASAWGADAARIEAAERLSWAFTLVTNVSSKRGQTRAEVAGDLFRRGILTEAEYQGLMS